MSFTLDPTLTTGQTFTVYNGVYVCSIQEYFWLLWTFILNDHTPSVKTVVQSPGIYGETVTIYVDNSGTNFNVNLLGTNTQ